MTDYTINDYLCDLCMTIESADKVEEVRTAQASVQSVMNGIKAFRSSISLDLNKTEEWSALDAFFENAEAEAAKILNIAESSIESIQERQRENDMYSDGYKHRPSCNEQAYSDYRASVL